MNNKNKDFEKLLIEKNSFITRDLVQKQILNDDFEFMNSEESIVIAKAVIENGEIVYL